MEDKPNPVSVEDPAAIEATQATSQKKNHRGLRMAVGGTVLAGIAAVGVLAPNFSGEDSSPVNTGDVPATAEAGTDVSMPILDTPASETTITVVAETPATETPAVVEAPVAPPVTETSVTAEPASTQEVAPFPPVVERDPTEVPPVIPEDRDAPQDSIPGPEGQPVYGDDFNQAPPVIPEDRDAELPPASGDLPPVPPVIPENRG